MKKQPRSRRTFLFLQGPHGSFFPKLGAALEGGGHAVRRVNLNGGDHATWPSGDDFRWPAALFSSWIRRYLARSQITDMVLFGDSRPFHVIAVRAAQERGIGIHIFEEGYVRPDWVTLERNGVNGNSTLPREAEWYLEQATRIARTPSNSVVPSYATARGWAAFFYYAEVVLQTWRFPFSSSHRDRDPVWEGIRYLRRFRNRTLERAQCEREEARIKGWRYVLLPLQLTSDYQIRVHSPFASMREAVSLILTNFARHAPADLKLVVKEHPLDSGLIKWRQVVETIATDLGIVDRVSFIEHGDLSALVLACDGMVTVNSTSGTLALAAGKPVKVLGLAVYDMVGITDPRPLDEFWSSPQAPDPAVYEAFYQVLVSSCLIPGAFLSNVGTDMLVAAATARLLSDEPIPAGSAGGR